MMAGLQMLKHIHALSDEVVCAQWRENPYFQYFCGEEFFRHREPIERSGMTHFRLRVGSEALGALLTESIAAAMRLGALKKGDLKKVAIDTTVQEKNVAHPTPHGLLLRAIEKVALQAKREKIPLRQSYLRVAKLAAIRVGKYRHAKQFKRAQRWVKFLRTRLGRLIRDVERKSGGNLSPRLKTFLHRAEKIRAQQIGDKNYIYSFHAPEVECIGKGKARKQYEFGNKVSLATNLKRARGGHFLLEAFGLHGNPYDGHTLADTLARIPKNTGVKINAAHLDKGYRGHGIGKNHPTKIFISGQRNLGKYLKQQNRRRAAIEPVIGHTKNDGLLGRNYLWFAEGDRTNPILCATGFNLRQLLRYLRALRKLFALFYQWLLRIFNAPEYHPSPNSSF
jgi:IS5 family transposase